MGALYKRASGLGGRWPKNRRSISNPMARTDPQTPALETLSALEIEVLQLDQRQRQAHQSRRSKLAAVEQITIEQATYWIAQLGGWIGKANGHPGSVTLARGLERLAYLVEGVALARAAAPPK